MRTHLSNEIATNGLKPTIEMRKARYSDRLLVGRVMALDLYLINERPGYDLLPPLDAL